MRPDMSIRSMLYAIEGLISSSRELARGKVKATPNAPFHDRFWNSASISLPSPVKVSGSIGQAAGLLGNRALAAARPLRYPLISGWIDSGESTPSSKIESLENGLN